MSTTVEPSVRVEVAGEVMTLALPNGKSVSFVWKKNPRMSRVTVAQLKNFKVTPYGISNGRIWMKIYPFAGWLAGSSAFEPGSLIFLYLISCLPTFSPIFHLQSINR